MGAGFSGRNGGGGRLQLQGPSLGDVPESCVAAVFQHLDPPEICRLAGLSRSFRGAAEADFVWELKLPSNYQFLARKALLHEIAGDTLTKKEIYQRLCRANRFDDGNKEFWLEKRSGKICLAISWKALRITGIDDRRYWIPIPTEESRFGTAAYLQQVWWLQMEGEVEFSFPAGSYSVFFRLHLGRPSRKLGLRVCNLEKVHGWGIKPVQFQLRTSDDHHAISQCYLRRTEEWIHYHVGDFTVEYVANTPMRVNFSMAQIDCTHKKGGLCVDSVFIYPIDSKDPLMQL